ncbi:QueT transporter family protein [Christensenellaceae bacterium OttesenSCG-928-K19]|nr:QueT transporter family protein [Christensenellaceae bacterium OttesenSCG-928-K19]
MRRKMSGNVRFITETAVIAAIYAVLTLVLAPFSFGPMQVRVSEALCVLPFFTPAAVPGLFIGCFIANATTVGVGVFDMIFGSLATLAAAFVTYKIKNGGKWLLPLPSVLINAFVVPWILITQYGVTDAYWYLALTVGVGQAIACYAIGMPLYFVLNRNRKAIFAR